MKRIAKSIVILVALASAALSIPQLAPQRGPDWLPIAVGYDSLVTTEKKYIIHNQREFNNYISEAFGVSAGSPQLNIDWDQTMVLAFHFGPCLSSGYDIYVQSVDAINPNGARVNYAVKYPGLGERTQMVTTSPYMVILLQRVTGNLTFMKNISDISLERYYGRNPVRAFGCTYPSRSQQGRCSCSSCSCCGDNGWTLLGTFVTYPNLSNLGTGASALPPVQWRTYKDGQRSNFTEGRTQIINNEAEFQSYWSKAFGEPAQNAPRDIQWGKEMLVAIHLGQVRNGGSKVYVETIDRPHPNDVVVHYVVNTITGGTPTTQVMSQPWVLVRLDRPGGNISFARRDVTQRVLTNNNREKCNCGGKCGCSCCRG